MARCSAKTAARHTSQEFVAFLAEVVANQPRGQEIHLIADNLSAHKTKRVTQFLAAHPKVHLYFTLTYSSWLTQVENWFARIERDVIARGIFTSVKDLARKPSCATSVTTIALPSPSSGPIAILHRVSASIPMSLLQATGRR
jgi:transposase